MPSRKFRLVVCENYRARNNLDVPVITQLLKQLKSGYKNARSSQKLLFAEMHILERVYYKGKNQHGLSLFWRSVVSVRRMASRIYEMNLPRLLEILGGEFHDEAFEGQKVFSGAWTRLPPPENLAQIIKRLIDIGSLLKAAIEAFHKAYRAFCLALPNTAFLQLSIVLVSIVSRTNSLASTFLENLSSIVPRVYAVFETLEPPEPLRRRLSKSLKNISFDPAQPNAEHLSAPNTLPPPSLPSNAMRIDQDEPEDLGSSIARPIATTVPLLVDPPPSTIDTTPLSPSPGPSQPPSPTEIFPAEAEAPADRAVSLATIVPRDRDVRVAVATSTKGKKKRKKARDEIDDIFG